jgi:hypothetical protein
MGGAAKCNSSPLLVTKEMKSWLSAIMMIIVIINMLLPVQQNSFEHLRVLLVLTDRGISARSIKRQ